jgi:AraC family transcriptional regulator
MIQLSDRFSGQRSLHTLVENQTSYHSKNAEMHIFETHQSAEKIFLQFHDPVIASMISGKKVMHLRENQPFEFFPGESVILPKNEVMCIDFPEASYETPTKCLALAVCPDEVRHTTLMMNETMPKYATEWTSVHTNFHFKNDDAIDQILQRMLYLYTENHASKDIFLDYMLRELLIRIFQTENKHYIEANAGKMANSNGLAFVLDYINKNMHQKLKVADLAKKAYMSETNFYRVFKFETGISPVDYINQLRLQKAMELLQNKNKKIKDILTETGFDSHSYFNRVFKMKFNIKPSEFFKNRPE